MTVYQTICSHTETMMELPTNQFKLFLHLDSLQRVLDDLSIQLANQIPEIKLVTLTLEFKNQQIGIPRLVTIVVAFVTAKQHLNARPVTHLKLATTLKTLAKLRSGPKKLETQSKQNSILAVSNLQLAMQNIIETSSQRTLTQK